QALAAVLGGTQSLHTNAFDEALALPSEDASRIALRTQQILAHETGVADVIDPLGGAYLVEHLTQTIYERARDYIRRIDELGGAVRAIETRFMQREIEESSYRWQKAVEAGERVVVGVNRYLTAGGQEPQILLVDEAQERAQLERLARVRRERDEGAVRTALAQV